MKRILIAAAVAVFLLCVGLAVYPTHRPAKFATCEAEWKSEKAMYLNVHNPQYTAKDEYNQAHHAFLDICEGRP